MALKDLVISTEEARALRALQRKASSPFRIDEHTWFYIEPAGLLFVHEVRVGDAYVRTDQFTVKWPTIRSAILTHERTKFAKRNKRRRARLQDNPEKEE